MANGTLFHHFATKKHLIEATYVTIIKDFGWQTVGVFDYPEKDLSRRLTKMVKVAIDYWVTHVTSLEFVRQVRGSKYFTAALNEQGRQYEKHFLNALRQAKKMRLLVKVDIEVLHHLVNDMIFSMAHLIIHEEDEMKRKKMRKMGASLVISAMLK